MTELFTAYDVNLSTLLGLTELVAGNDDISVPIKNFRPVELSLICKRRHFVIPLASVVTEDCQLNGFPVP